jgi:pimeloyl-ACP methyl ester carboxylesterase
MDAMTHDSSARPPLIYLPGLDGTGRLLHRQPALYESHNVHCVSYPQDRPATYADLASLGIAHLEKTGPGVVLAESFGGAVALTLALLRPDLVRRLVLINTFAYFPARLLIHLAAWAGRFFPPRPSTPASRGLRGPFFFAPDIPAEERQQWWERTGGVPMQAFGFRLNLIAGLDLRSKLSSIRIPALVLAAPNDRLVPSRAGRELARLLPSAHLIKVRAGHAALIHPRVNIARLLAEPSYWPADRAAATADAAAGSRPG